MVNPSADLTKRRAEFVYMATRLAAQAANAPIIPRTWELRDDAFRTQFMKAIAKQCTESRSTSPEDMHEAWMASYLDMGWVHGKTYDPDGKVHPDLVPFDQLVNRERDKDEVFLATCEIARLWIYEKEGDN